MSYALGVMDLYPIVANKTPVENTPFVQMVLKEKVDPDRLKKAVEFALSQHPLFGCTLQYHRGYVLVENEGKLPIFHCKEEERPLCFGAATDGFLWQLCYSDCALSFEWSHAVSDGKGGFAFLSTMMSHYCGEPAEAALALDLGLESLYDKTEKGIPQKKQEAGFRASDLPYEKRGYLTDCHILKAPMSQVLKAAKKNDSSPAAVLPPLFSMALRKHLSPKAKNRNVCCNVVIDCRVPMKIATMHNCIITKNITYVDPFDSMPFSKVSTIYRAILDLAVQPENIVAKATETVDSIRPLVNLKPRFLQKAVGQLVARVIKHTDSNFTFTYLGKLSFPEKVMESLADFNVRSWTDFGECNMAAVDVSGTLIINVCENYKEKSIIPDFIALCQAEGIQMEETRTLPFEQANLRMKL